MSESVPAERLEALRKEAWKMCETGGSTLVPDARVLVNRLDAFAQYVIEQCDALLAEAREEGKPPGYEWPCDRCGKAMSPGNGYLHGKLLFMTCKCGFKKHITRDAWLNDFRQASPPASAGTSGAALEARPVEGEKK